MSLGDDAVMSGPGVAGVWAALGERLDPVAVRPRLADGVETNTIEVAGAEPYTVVRDPGGMSYYRLEAPEAALLALMDGSRTVGDLVVAQFRRSGRLDVDQVGDLVRGLHEGGYLSEPYVDAIGALTRAVHPPDRSWRARAGRAVSELDVSWSGADPFVRWAYGHGMRHAFSRAGALAAGLVAVAGMAAFWSVGSARGFEVSVQQVGFGLVMLFVLDMLLVFIHEFGHAVTLIHYGRRVNGAGFRLYFGTPAFYIESSDVLMLDRRRRMVQSFAGPGFEMVATGVAALLLLVVPEGAIESTLYRFVVLNYFVLLLNLVPFLELDGYFIASDALRLPDLRPRSLAFVRHDLWRKLRRRERFDRADLGLGLYGVAGVAFTVLTLFTAAFFWEKTFGDFVSRLIGAGPLGIAGLVAVVVVLAGPAVRGAGQAVRALSRSGRRQWGRLRFRTQRPWRVEAARLLDAQAVFDDLPGDLLGDLAGRVQLRAVGAGTTVVRQGDRADRYYLVRRGTLDVIDEGDHAGQASRVIRTLGPGDAFGELALATRAARSATVRATTEAQLFVIDGGTFDRLLADHLEIPDLEPTFEAVAELRALGPFAHLGVEDLVALRDRGGWVDGAAGDDVVTQGDAGDAFYVVGAGRLEVIEDGRRVRELGPGEPFGEIALLLDVPRTATVRALTPTRLFRLDRDGFDDLVRHSFRTGTLASIRPTRPPVAPLTTARPPPGTA